MEPKQEIPNQYSKKEESVGKNDSKFSVPENELTITFVRSSGKGGQNVNKVETKAKLEWNVNNSSIFSAEEKEKIKKFFLDNFKSKMTEDGRILIVAQEERSQLQNREKAIYKLNKLINEALAPTKDRLVTSPTEGSKKERLANKKLESKKKKDRGWKYNED